VRNRVHFSEHDNRRDIQRAEQKLANMANLGLQLTRSVGVGYNCVTCVCRPCYFTSCSTSHLPRSYSYYPLLRSVCSATLH